MSSIETYYGKVTKRGRPRKGPLELTYNEWRGHTYFNSFERQCKHDHIPYPNQCSPRETDHLNICRDCREIWPLFVFRYCFKEQKSLEEVSQMWYDMPESERRTKGMQLQSAIRRFLLKLSSRRCSTNYQLFHRDQAATMPLIPDMKTPVGSAQCKARNAKILQMWRQLDPTLQAEYTKLAIELKQKKKQDIKNLPAFARKWVNILRSEKAQTIRQQRPKRPTNRWLLFLQEGWREEKAKPDHMPYPMFVDQCKHEWKNMTETQRAPYTEEAQKLAEAYRAEKAQRESVAQAAYERQQHVDKETEITRTAEGTDDEFEE